MAESKSNQQNMEPEQLTVDSELEETADETIKEPPEMCSTFGFKEKSWKTDFTLVAEGTKFHVAKLVLALASPVFERMFESEFKEKTCDELELVGKRAEDVNEFLLAVYPRAPHALSKEKALNVLPLAEEYQVLYLKQKCEDALLGSTDTTTETSELYRLIMITHRYDLKTLLAKCVSLVSERSTDDIERENRNILLPAEPLRDIFQNVLKGKTELELSDLKKSRELETYKTLMHFMSRTLKRADVPEFDKNLVWMGSTLIFTIDMIENKPVTETVVIWGTELQIIMKLKRTWGWDDIVDEFYAYIANVKNKTECHLKVQSVVLNKLPTKEHLSSLHKTEFSSKKQTIECCVAQLAQIKEQEKGFVYEAKVQIELNIMMSKPKKLD